MLNQELELSLNMAFARAREHRHEFMTVEHLLLALLSNPSAREALEILAARSRDNSRTPMQWTDERYCGFSDTKPWIPVSDNFEKINVKKQKQDRDSILEFYKKLIEFINLDLSTAITCN